MGQIPVKFKTSNCDEGSWYILTPENLREVKVKFENIKKIESFFEVPGVLYTEPGVASETHPTGGSVGVWIYTNTGQRASIQDIIYYDSNIHKTHYNGLPHWNHERRFIDVEGNEKRVGKGIEYHAIDKSDQIAIHFKGKKKAIIKKRI